MSYTKKVLAALEAEFKDVEGMTFNLEESETYDSGSVHMEVPEVALGSDEWQVIFEVMAFKEMVHHVNVDFMRKAHGQDWEHECGLADVEAGKVRDVPAEMVETARSVLTRITSQPELTYGDIYEDGEPQPAPGM